MKTKWEDSAKNTLDAKCVLSRLEVLTFYLRSTG